MSEQRAYATGRARQQQILAEATRAFGRAGFDGVTVQEIATACGISRQGLLHHFGSKEGLLMRLLEERDAADHAVFQRELEESGSPLQAILAVVRRNAETPGISAMFTQLASEAIRPEHPAHGFFQGVYLRIQQELTAALSDLQADGRLRPTIAAHRFAAALIALRDGLALQMSLADRADGATTMIDTLEAMFALVELSPHDEDEAAADRERTSGRKRSAEPPTA